MKSLVSIALALLLAGCATLGWVPDFLGFGDDEGKTIELIALEGAAVVGVANYVAMMKNMPETMSHAEHLRMAVASANNFVLTAYPDLGKDAEQLLENYATTVSRGKWTPKIKLLYGYVYEALNLIESLGGDDSSFNHILEPTLELEPLVEPAV